MLGGASLLMNVQTDGAIKMYRTPLNGDGCKKIKKSVFPSFYANIVSFLTDYD